MLDMMAEGKSVQRSSSLKLEREKSPYQSKVHDRNSERRKTCLPVITPSSSADNLVDSCGADNPDDLDALGSSPKCVYKIGDDDVEIEKDKVKRTTQGELGDNLE